jgi:hypothetical protein
MEDSEIFSNIANHSEVKTYALPSLWLYLWC